MIAFHEYRDFLLPENAVIMMNSNHNITLISKKLYRHFVLTGIGQKETEGRAIYNCFSLMTIVCLHLKYWLCVTHSSDRSD